MNLPVSLSPYFPCAECWGQGEIGFDRNESHARGEYVGYECDTCGGSGFAQRGHLLEALGARWECVLIPQMVARTGADFDPDWEPCVPDEPHDRCHWAVKP